jgi:bifunctional non-homologous end joining protein LigD
MPKPPGRRPVKRKTDTALVRVAGRRIRAENRRQPELFTTPMPEWIDPCLPTLVERPPTGPQWAHEIKWDGYRVSVYVDGGKVAIRTRRGLDWTKRFPAIAEAAAKLPVASAVLDGEAVMLHDQGRSQFSELQAALAKGSAREAVLYAFDLLYLDGHDLRKLPLKDRRDALVSTIGQRDAILFSEEYEGEGLTLFRKACAMDLEGIVCKRRDKPYRSGLTYDWVKVKCVKSAEFVVIGYQPSAAMRTAIGSLHGAASEEGGKLRYVGGVGTGFSEAIAVELKRALDTVMVSSCAVPRLRVKGAVWVMPALRIQVAYRGLTGGGDLRHASFKGFAGERDFRE